jgi:glycosyltransferase involved in cell wall biosynthesis
LFNRKIKIEEITIPTEEHTGLSEIIDTKVSVVIPTKNAGNDFEYVLNKLRSQKGLKELEIVVVDSGSTDDTIRIARKYGAKLHQIKPEEFDHGKTRNFGAEKATGEFALFATQDDIPLSEYLIYKMVKVLQSNPKTAAVTCRQIPRSDGDLMACFQVWNHCQKFLDINEDKITSVEDMTAIPPIQKRKLANLSDSCCCIRRDLFLQYRFKINFAEDLELGIRLLDDGYKLAYLHSAAIIHSHNRSPSYFFKVSYTDSKVVSQIIGNEPLQWNTKNISIFYANIKKLYEKVIWAISMIEKENQNEINGIFLMLDVLLNSDYLKMTEDYMGNPDLDKLFNEIESIINYSENEQMEDAVYNFLLSAYLGTLSTFKEYAISYPSLFSIKKDFISTLYKLFANSSGAALGNFILFLYGGNLSTKEIENLDKFLSGGV